MIFTTKEVFINDYIKPLNKKIDDFIKKYNEKDYEEVFTCSWDYDGLTETCTPKCVSNHLDRNRYNIPELFFENFKYCPFCGRVIGTDTIN